MISTHQIQVKRDARGKVKSVFLDGKEIKCKHISVSDSIDSLSEITMTIAAQVISP